MKIARVNKCRKLNAGALKIVSWGVLLFCMIISFLMPYFGTFIGMGLVSNYFCNTLSSRIVHSNVYKVLKKEQYNYNYNIINYSGVLGLFFWFIFIIYSYCT